MTLFMFSFLSLLVLFLEPWQFGFDLKGHLGWVPSHVAAQIIKARPENYFVGYTLELFNGDTRLLYYFDRYPLLFSALTRFCLSPFENDLRLWVYFSKIYMDLIFLATVFGAYKVTGYFTKDALKRGSVILLTFSGYYFLRYKSMLHFDQPAILGMVAMVESIFHFEETGRKRRFIFWSIFAPLLGRGYANLFVLSLYFIIKFFKKVPLKQLTKVAFITLIPAVIICSSFLSYNIFTEAKIRSISVTEVSIVKSALSRLGLEKLDEVREKSVRWPNFLLHQFNRIMNGLAPHFLGKLGLGYGILLTLVLIYFYRKKRIFIPEDLRFKYLFLTLSGFIWVLPMKRLAAFHDYTTLYYWGFFLSFYLLISELFKNRLRLFAVASFIMLVSILSINVEIRKRLPEINLIGDEFFEIRKLLSLQENKGKTIYILEGHREILPGRPYILGFYLFDYALSDNPSSGEFILSRAKQNLKPLFEGQRLNLYVK